MRSTSNVNEAPLDSGFSQDNLLRDWEAAMERREQEVAAREKRQDRRDEEVSSRERRIEQAQSDLDAREAQLRKAAHEHLEGYAQRLETLRQEVDAERERRFAEVRILAEQTKTRLLADAEAETNLLRESRERLIRSSEQELDRTQKAFDLRRKEFDECMKKGERHLLARMKSVQEAEAARDADFATQRESHDQAVAARDRKALEALEIRLGEEREARLAAVAAEAAVRREETERALQEIRAAAEQDRAAAEAAIRQEKKLLQDRASAMTEREAAVADRELTAAFREKNAALHELRNAAEREGLQDLVEERLAERLRSCDEQEKSAAEECARLRVSLSELQRRCDSHARLTQRFPEDPLALLSTLEEVERQRDLLREEMTRRPTAELRQNHDALLKDLEQTRRRNDEQRIELEDLRRQAMAQDDLQGRIVVLESNLRREQGSNTILEAACARLEADLKRLSAGFEREADRDVRISEIEVPCFNAPHRRRGDHPDELDWLDGIDRSCRDYGLRFPRRIIHAFHTSLKTAEWSPLTVLAGVSGTGKSELPRLYALFGGLKFMNVPVQPNWDSQEAMLGFFNSIDNKFDAQPLLRLLAQTQKPPGEGHGLGLQDALTLVLLDEMNLAHVELYFAEFLSKLEQRRGVSQQLPQLEVKLGAGVKPYGLPLGRNLLWCGTMNQDETTKALSDKVIDRGFLIHFPSPASFERRPELKPLPNPEDTPLLTYQTWSRWRRLKSEFDERRILPFKTMMEEINRAMNAVGRALGNRVWQSQEYYMANYPDVIAARKSGNPTDLEKAMRMAFEDQLVLKVMPKLRGLDTRGASRTECLDRIRELLGDGGYGIIGDFDRACEVGYGQFIWSSADYLRVEEAAVAGEPDLDAA